MDLISPTALSVALDLEGGTIAGVPLLTRRLSDLRGTFADSDAYEAALAQGDPPIYTVASVTPAEGAGQLHYGLGTLLPGRVGAEYYLTKGHLHAWRPAAEVYIGLGGEGAMLLEHEESGESTLLPLRAGSVVYVPGHTAHRTINTGDTPLVYLGVYPADAGHDYGAIGRRNFRKVLVCAGERPTLLDRAAFLESIARQREEADERS